MERIEEIYGSYRVQVEFFLVYVQEAHPTDGWQTDSNLRDGVLFAQHKSVGERETVAQSCSLDRGITVPILIEDMDDAVDEAYGAAPERLYLIGADGRVVYKGGAGPFFFDLDQWEQAIQAYIARSHLV